MNKSSSSKLSANPNNKNIKTLKASPVVFHKPREVEIRVIFLRIGDIDTLNEKFFSEILIEAKWEEPKLVNEFSSTNAPGNAFKSYSEEKELTSANKYWNPQIYIENALNDPQQTMYYKLRKEVVYTNASSSSLQEIGRASCRERV